MYWDLKEEDPERRAVDEHLVECEACAEEFMIWQESMTLIREVPAAELQESRMGVSSSVMSRIYAEESWRVPVADRFYHFSGKLRRNFMASIAACLLVFAFTFWVSIMQEPSYEPATSQSSVFGRIGDPAVAAGGQQESMNVHAMPTAVASLKGFNQPVAYQIGPIHTLKDYLLFVSLLGLTSTLLIMNWLSRTRQ
nr:zf-HC2 domain-containing protein [Paenibacillus sp. YYML68]